jgi:cytochrome c oxidase subunit 2
VSAPERRTEPRHGRRVVVAWLVASVIATPLVIVFLGPHIPPGNHSAQGTEQVFDNTWMTAIATPVVVLMVVFFAYTLSTFKRRGDGDGDGPPIRENPGVQLVWLAVTGTTVLFLAGFGTYELLQNGAGGGQGPSPVAVPTGPKMQVQVIAQQWEFTYRYPGYGGIETPHLVLPAGTQVELHVTSLDAVHSFWAYELGVKADANPGVDNIAYVRVKGPGLFHIHCAELCGLWHGYMFDTGRVVTTSEFASWIKQQQQAFHAVMGYLPKYAKEYLPDPQRRAG